MCNLFLKYFSILEKIISIKVCHKVATYTYQRKGCGGGTILSVARRKGDTQK